MGSLKGEQFEIPCPGCGKKVKKPLRWFERDQACPFGCGTTFNAKEVARVIEKGLKDFMKAFK